MVGNTKLLTAERRTAVRATLSAHHRKGRNMCEKRSGWSEWWKRVRREAVMFVDVGWGGGRARRGGGRRIEGWRR